MVIFKKLISAIKPNLILSLIIAGCLLAPDYLAQTFSNFDKAAFSIRFTTGLLAFGFFLSFTPLFFAFLIILFFLSLELVQFGHLFYYHSLIRAHKFALLFAELDEVISASKEAIKYLYLAPLVVIIPYALIFISFIKLQNSRCKNNIFIVFVLLVLSIFPARVYETYNGINYFPDPADHSLRNSLYAFNNYLLNRIFPSELKINKYLDYKVSENAFANEKINIILIIGESVNPRYMSLFGYDQKTTPLLDSLKTDPNFVALKAISSAVNTNVSVPLLLNGIFEPNNYEALETKPVNLFKLAKKQNFKTFYISAQSGALLSNIDSEFIDEIIFKEKNLISFSVKQDEALIDFAKKQTYSEKNFIVIHKRNIHAPYENNYSHNSKYSHLKLRNNNYQELLLSTYENAIKFEDELIFQTIDFYRKNFNQPTYIFFTPDHGEGLGIDNVYGHSDLKPEVYNILFLGYLNNDNFNIKEEIAKISEPICHFEIHNLVAKLLGFDITNPNKQKNSCFVQGSNLYGNNDFVEVKK